MQYSDLVTWLAGLIVIEPTDANFLAMLPEAINYAELRIQRDLDFLQSRITQAGPALTVGSRAFTLSGTASQYVVTEQINVVVSGQRTVLTWQSRPYMDTMYADGTGVGTPVDVCPVDTQNYLVGPCPNAAVATEAYGTIRFTELSATNATNWLSLNLPDLYLDAAMIFVSGWMKNYAGASSDDPQQPVNWEMQYRTLLDGAKVEEVRKLFTHAPKDRTPPASSPAQPMPAR